MPTLAGMHDTARLFVALWPGDAVRELLAAHQAQWQWPRGAARVARDKLHATLHFLGDVPRERIASLQQALPTLAVQPFELGFTTATVWHGGIAVLNTTLPQALADLHADIGRVLQQQGVKLEARAYKPHVTMARKAMGARAPADVPSAAWAVQGFALVESLRGRYAVLPPHTG